MLLYRESLHRDVGDNDSSVVGVLGDDIFRNEAKFYRLQSGVST